MRLRCRIDGLTLRAWVDVRRCAIVACDGDETFVMDRVEAAYYDVVEASNWELCRVEALGYRLLGCGSKQPKETTACGVVAPQAVGRVQRISISRS